MSLNRFKISIGYKYQCVYVRDGESEEEHVCRRDTDNKLHCYYLTGGVVSDRDRFEPIDEIEGLNDQLLSFLFYYFNFWGIKYTQELVKLHRDKMGQQCLDVLAYMYDNFDGSREYLEERAQIEQEIKENNRNMEKQTFVNGEKVPHYEGDFTHESKDKTYEVSLGGDTLTFTKKGENLNIDYSGITGEKKKIEHVNYAIPPYYNGVYEPIKVANAWDLGFHEANALKYLRRAGKKDPSKYIEDIEKATNCLNRKVSDLKNGIFNSIDKRKMDIE